MSQSWAAQQASAPLSTREWKTCSRARLLSRNASALPLLCLERSASSLVAACRTVSRMAGSTRVLPFRTRETVEILTCARAAISRSPTRAFSESSFAICLLLAQGQEQPFSNQIYRHVKIFPTLSKQMGHFGTGPRNSGVAQQCEVRPTWMVSEMLDIVRPIRKTAGCLPIGTTYSWPSGAIMRRPVDCNSTPDLPVQGMRMTSHESKARASHQDFHTPRGRAFARREGSVSCPSESSQDVLPHPRKTN